jgi:hypothetical protein
MTTAYPNQKTPTPLDVFVVVVDCDRVGEMIALNALDSYKGGKRYLSLADLDSLTIILNTLCHKTAPLERRPMVKYRYDPKTLTAELVDLAHPNRTLVITWASRTQYFHARARYLGYPPCCVDHHVKNFRSGSVVEPAPVGIIRCPNHRDMEVEEYVLLINKHRWHHERQRLDGRIPSPKDFFLHLTALGLTRFSKPLHSS